MKALSIRDFADIELLHVVDDNHGRDTAHIAEVLEAQPRSVGCRFSWMKRNGLIDRDSEGGWVLTRRGTAVITSRSENLDIIRNLSRIAARDPVMHWVAKREWDRNLR